MKKIPIYVLDTSVIVKPVLEEQGSDIVCEIFQRKENYGLTVFVPEFFSFEFLNAVKRGKNAMIALEAYKAFMARQVCVIPFEEDLIKKTLAIVKKYPRASYYDSAFHALAKAYKVDLVTADKKYYQMTKKEGDVVLLEDLKL